MTTELETLQALTTSRLISDVLADEMAKDDRIVVFGEDIATMGGVFGATRQLHRAFGDDRVRDTPISETAFVGLAVGAAQAGLRPIVELMFVDFLGVCFDQLANQMAKNTYMSGGRVRVPVVVRTAVGSIGAAAQHSQVLSATFAHIPGLKVVYPSTPGDACRLLRAAIADENPVIFLEHKRLLMSRVGKLPYADDLQPLDEPALIGQARMLREGDDLLLVSAGYTVQLAMLAANELAAEGISVGVLDLRTIVPLDRAALTAAAEVSKAVLVVDEDYRDFGTCSEVMASISEALGHRAPLLGRHAPDVPIPASKVLEEAVLPSAASIARSARNLLGRL